MAKIMKAIHFAWTPVCSAVLQDPDLTLQEKGMYSIICSYTRPLDGKVYMWAGLEELKKRTGLQRLGCDVEPT